MRSRTIVICGRKASAIGRKFAVLINTPHTLLISFRDAGWQGSQLMKTFGPISLWRRK